MIPYGHQDIDETDIKEVIKVLKSDWLTQGPKILEFEKALAKYCTAKYAVAVCNGTAALHLAYSASNIQKGDEVIVTPNTFAATTNMFLALGAKPIFCDINLDTYNIDETKIEKLITKKTKAIVPVDFAGQPNEMGKIMRIAKKHKLIVIEDACQSLGAKYMKKKIGSIADLTVFSFHPVKSITTGEGGAIITNNKKYYDKLLLFRNHGIYKDKTGKNVMTELGFNYRITDIQTALGINQLKKIDSFIYKRHQVVKWYEQELNSLKEIVLPQELPHNYSAWHLYVIRARNLNERNELVLYLKKNKIGVNFHYPAVYSHPYYRKNGFKNFKLKNEDIYQDTCITLPCFTQLKKSEVKYISNKIKKFYGYK